MKTITLPDDLEHLLTEEAKRCGTSLESLLRDAINISRTRPDTEAIQKLRETLRKHLGGRTRVPVQVEMDDERKFVIDSMQQYKIEGSVLLIGRRNRILEVEYIRLDIGHIVRVISFNELPPKKGALSYRAFLDRVQPLLRAKPFQPFELELLDNRKYIIAYTTQLIVNGRFCGYHAEPESPMASFGICDVVRISLLVPVPVAVPA